MSEDNKLIVYQTDDGAIALKADAEQETVWATRMQMAEIFGVNPQAISKHIKNVYAEEELEEVATSSKMELVQDESGRQVRRQVKIYNLDVLISVGYRINSKIGTKFRKWATKTLKQHITQGSNRSSIQLEAGELYRAVEVLKQDLIAKGQATPLFAQEKSEGSLQGIVGNSYQSAFGEDVYPTLEEKAANLLYFIIKNHPFNDGNKRTAAFAFIWFLQKAGIDFKGRLTPEALTSITLLIAESNPASKERMIGLVILLLTGRTSHE